MSFTTVDTIRKHLIAAVEPEQSFENVSVQFVGTDQALLPHANLVDSTVHVKLLASELPERESAVLLVDEDLAALSNKSLARGSIVVAKDFALTQVFDEERDYRVDYQNGRLWRLSAGDIPNSFPVVVWYDRYENFEETADFIVDYAAGSVRRAAGSGIPDGATALVDYTVAQGAAEDALIEVAITEAEDVIVRNLRDGYSASSTDQGLKTGANYLTLSIVARSMSALTLTRNVGSDAYSRAREWQQLSEKWLAAAWQVLAPFITPHSMRPPFAD
ncbi:MAG: hypothetical protein IPG71_04185 [bacterium]|nr:hypothetical protein [bacterium]